MPKWVWRYWPGPSFGIDGELRREWPHESRRNKSRLNPAAGCHIVRCVMNDAKPIESAVILPPTWSAFPRAELKRVAGRIGGWAQLARAERVLTARAARSTPRRTPVASTPVRARSRRVVRRARSASSGDGPEPALAARAAPRFAPARPSPPSGQETSAGAINFGTANADTPSGQARSAVPNPFAPARDRSPSGHARTAGAIPSKNAG